MPSWTEEKKLKLLLAIICTQKIELKDWDLVCKALNNEFNINACQQQFHKLRRDAAVSLPGIAGGEQSTPKKTISSGGTPKTNATSTPTPRGRKRKSMADSEDTPTSKREKIIKKEIKDEPITIKDESPTPFPERPKTPEGI